MVYHAMNRTFAPTSVHRRKIFAVLVLVILCWTVYLLLGPTNNHNTINSNFGNTVVPVSHGRQSWGQADRVKVLANDSLAKDLASRVSILCLVLTIQENTESSALAVNQTWGRRCTKLLFVATQPMGDLPHIVVKVTKGRDHLTAKTMAMFKYAASHYADRFDWFLKADDDTFVVMENLRYLLSFHDPKENVYVGHHFKRYLESGYMSGGAGYAISREALKLFHQKSHLCKSDGVLEDLHFGACMQKLGVPPYDTKDMLRREAFHAVGVLEDLLWIDYIKEHAKQVKGPIHVGPSCCSQMSVTFHKVTSPLMYLLEFMLYRMSVYGRHTPDRLFDGFFQTKVLKPGNYLPDPEPHFV